MKLSDITNRLTELTNEAATLSKIDLDKRTESENVQLENVLGEFDKLNREKAIQERMENLAAPAPRKVSGPASQPKATSFQNHGEFYKAVANAASGNVDPRLLNAAGDYVQEGTNADGGYALIVDARSQILQAITGPESLAGRCEQIFCSGNSITLPADEDPVWSGVGIHSHTVGESVAYTPTTPILKQLSITLAKTGTLVYVTEEMLTDVSNIGSFVTNKTAAKLDWTVSDAVFNAMVTAPSVKTVAKTGGAGAGSGPDLANLEAMWAACYTPFRNKAIWIMNPSLEAGLRALTVGNFGAYLPAGGLAGAPFATLMGRPVIFSEHAKVKGTEGDVVLVDPSSFFVALKNNGVQNAVSAHFKFDQDLVAYKATIRFAAISKLKAVITRPDSTTCSNVVTLATRA